MSFATLRRLRYVVLILTRADMEASQRYIVGNGINASRALFANLEYSCTYCTKFQSAKESELGLCSLRALQFQILLMKVGAAHFLSCQQ